MKLFHRHKWTRWKQVTVRVVDRHGRYLASAQERTCESCGRIQQEFL